MNLIHIKGIRCNSTHGCLDEESIIGAEYEVAVLFYLDFSKTHITDNLQDTINYVLVNKVVVFEMSNRSNLIENVAYRIIYSLKNLSSKIIKCRVEIKKTNPPIEGDVKYVSVAVEESF